MAETLLPYSLTTVQRVKDRLGITASGFDSLILRLINAVTDLIEGETNRRFLETVYTNEVYSVYGENQEYLLLRQAPVSALTSFQYRAGTVSNPSWTDFITDSYELLEDGKSGIIKIYGGLPRGVNSVRVTYVAGYKINWTNYGDNSTHTLPADITDLAERLIVKLFKKRESEGKQSESFEGGNVNWKELFDEVDKDIINRYKRLPAFI
jgi:hypothetical protein